MMAESTSLKSNTSIEDDTNKKPQENVTPPSTTSPPQPTSTAPIPPAKSPQEEALMTLQEAFPSVDREVIEAILESQRGNVNASFDILLGMSDPDSTTTANNDNNSTADDNRYALQQQEKDDELLARQLAKEYDQQQQRLQQAQQQQQQQRQNESVFSGFQEELPVIKERVIEAGNVAKKKIMGFYNSFMEQGSSSDSNNGNHYSQQQQQQGGLVNDMQGLRISSDQVNTNRSPPPLVRTSTGDQQLEDDAAFARRLAMEDAQLERLAAERKKSVIQTSTPVDSRNKRIDVEEGETVTFTTPDAVPTNKEKKDQHSAYVINDEDDDDIDYYGVDDNTLSKNGRQQQDKRSDHQETTSSSDPKQ